MTTQGVWAVLRSSEWQAVEQCNAQVVFLGEFAENDAKAQLSTNDIGKMFNIRSGNIRQIRHKADRKRENPHTSLHLALNKKLTLFVSFTSASGVSRHKNKSDWKLGLPLMRTGHESKKLCRLFQLN
jgi:hypothetical protein